MDIVSEVMPENLYFQNLSQKIAQAQDLEEKLNAIRIYKKEETAKIEAQDFSGAASLPETFIKLSHLADAILEVTLGLAKSELAKNYGYPTFVDNSGNLMQGEFAIIAMGKLGGEEIH